MNIDPKYKAILSVALTTAGGAIVSYLSTQLGNGVPTTADQWKAVAVGALVAASAALLHLFQTPPAVASMAYKASLRRPDPNERGFSPVRDLAIVAAIGCAFAVAVPACALFQRSVAPAEALGKCLAPDIESAVITNDGLATPLGVIDLVAELVIKCGGDAMALFQAILGDTNPAVKMTALYHEAEALSRDPVAMDALRSHVAAKVSARKAGAAR